MLAILWLLAIGSPEGVLAASTDSARALLDEAAKASGPLRQASAYALANLAERDKGIREMLKQAVEDADKDVFPIALTALEILNPASSTLHRTKQHVLEKFFQQAVDANNVPGLVKLILANTDALGELCESLDGDLLQEVLPKTAATLLTWGVTHNKYAFVKLIIERGGAHITNKLRNCLGKRVTKIAAEKGYRALFSLLVNNGDPKEKQKDL